MLVWSYVQSYFSVASNGKKLVHFWKWSHDWFCWFLISCYNCVYWIYPLWCHFLVFLPLLGYPGALILVYPLWLYQFSFFTFSLFLGVTAEFLLGWIFNGFFYEFACCSFSGYALSIGNFVVSAWVNRLFNWYEFLIWVSYRFTCRSLSWYAPLTVILGGDAGEVDFPYRNLGISMLPCVNLLVLLVVWQVLDFVVHELNPLWN